MTYFRGDNTSPPIVAWFRSLGEAELAIPDYMKCTCSIVVLAGKKETFIPAEFQELLDAPAPPVTVTLQPHHNVLIAKADSIGITAASIKEAAANKAATVADTNSSRGWLIR